VEFGEHPEEAVIREVKEETGFDVETTGIAGVDSMVYRFPGPPRHAIRLLFHATILGGEMKPETNGSTDRCEWIDRKQAAGLQLVDLAQRGMDIALGPHSDKG
jgi:ADP-ribose pyrophosphatase YjhB (NUDIX family)